MPVRCSSTLSLQIPWFLNSELPVQLYLYESHIPTFNVKFLIQEPDVLIMPFSLFFNQVTCCNSNDPF